jgi:hypothetical protein
MPRKGMPGDLQSVASEDSDDDDDDDRSTSSFVEDEDHSEKSETEAESDRDETEEINKLIRKESKDVLMWREIVTGMLVITAALVTITTYVLLSREEVDDFTRAVSADGCSVWQLLRFKHSHDAISLVVWRNRAHLRIRYRV